MADNPLLFNFYLEMLASAAVFCHRLPKRSRAYLRIPASVIVYGLLWWLLDTVLPLSSFPFGIEYILMLFALMGLALFCFTLTPYQAFFCAVISYATQHCFFRTAVVITYYGSAWLGLPSALSYAAAFVLFFGALLLLVRKNLRSSAVVHIKASSLLNICAVIILSEIVIVRRFLTLSFWHMDYALYAACSFYQALASGFIVALLITLANRGSLIEEMELLNVLHDRERKQMNLSREYSELINIKAHDLKRRLEQSEKALSDEERTELKALLDAYSDRYHTENETFNLILNETVMRCERAGIDFHCMADVPLLDGMRSGDLYSLLGNALENAVEAAAKCGAERYIRVNIASVAEMLSIHIENTFAGQLTTENGKLRSTKPDPSGHGFGVRSMEWIVKRYDGTMTFSDANGIFSEDILLPLPLARKKDDLPQTIL